MRNVSTQYFDLDGAPVLSFLQGHAGPLLSLRDSKGDRLEPDINFYVRNEDPARLRMAVEAFNAVMREPAAQEKEGA